MTTITNSFNSLIEFVQLQTRERHPSGSFDKAGRFYLDNCPAYIREPSRAYPLSQMQHGRTLEYVVNSNEANEEEIKELKKLVNRVAKETKGQSLTKLNVTERTEVLTKINKQLKTNSKEYKNWLKSFTAEQLKDLKEAVKAQIKK
ncbi:TPA: hypothetical protein ACKROA_003558 [Pseudomonas aeruginosa]